MTEPEPLYSGALQFYAAHHHSFATRRFDDFRPGPNRDSLFVSDHTLGIGANWAVPRVIPGEWTVTANLPLTWREFRARVGDRVITDRVHGPGDAVLGARFRWLWWVPAEASQVGASFSLGMLVHFPTGETTAHRDGKPVPRDLQLGDGAFGLTFFHSAIYSNNRLELISHLSYHWRSIGIGGSNFDFGDEISGDIELKYRVIQERFPGNTMFLSLAVNFSRSDFDRDNGVRVKDSGGWRVQLEPRVQWHPKPWWQLKAEFFVPVFQNTHGEQLVKEVAFKFSVAWRFSP